MKSAREVTMLTSYNVFFLHLTRMSRRP